MNDSDTSESSGELERLQRESLISLVAGSSMWGVVLFLRKLTLPAVSPVPLNALSAILIAISLKFFMRIPLRRAWQSFCEYPLVYFVHGIIGTVGGVTLVFFAMSQLPLSVAVLIGELRPVFVLIFARIALGERFPLAKWPYAAGAILAAYIISVEDPFHLQLEQTRAIGIAAMLLGSMCYAISSVIARSMRVKDVRASDMTFVRFVIAGSVLLPSLFLVDRFQFRFEIDAYYLILIVCGSMLSGVCYVLFYHGLGRIEAGVSSFIEILTALVSAILGLMFLHEQFGVVQIMAVPLLLICIYRIQFNRPKRVAPRPIAI